MTKGLCSITWKIRQERLFMPDFQNKMTTICLRGGVSGDRGSGRG